MPPDIDFNAPLVGNAQERDDAKKGALGLRLDEARELVAVLDTQLSAEAWGYAQLDDIEDEVQRAIVSDQVRGAAHGIEENLLEARLHELDAVELVGPNGLTMPYTNASINDHLRYDRLELNIVGFFRAFGSTLDCLAAVLIGVTRVPMSIRFADMGRLATFDPGSRGRLWPNHIPDAQLAAWTELTGLLDTARKRKPEGWYVWGLEMRNALLHRGRGARGLLQRRMSGRLAVVSETPPAALMRFDYFLRKRPWLPDLAQLARADGAGDVWLHEPVQDTLRVLFEAVSDMVAELTAWALVRWTEQGQNRTFVAPVRAWEPGPEPETAFSGFSERRTAAEFDSLMVGTGTAEHMRLAEQLRIRLTEEQDDGPQNDSAY